MVTEQHSPISTSTPENSPPIYDLTATPPPGWLPTNLVPLEEPSRGVSWYDMRGAALEEPFLHQAIARIKLERPDTRELITDLEALLRFEKTIESLPPKGFIFHTSRCGSTLLANALNCLDRSLIISESHAIGALTSLYFEHSENKLHEIYRHVLLRAAVKALGQKFCGDEQRYFIKFTNINVLHLHHIKRIWPHVPCIFLYRNPVEVIYSNIKVDAGWMRIEEYRQQSAFFLGETEELITRMSREEFCARMFGRICRIVTETSGGDSAPLLVNYRELSLPKLCEISRFFGVDPTPSEIEAIRSRMQFYSKDAKPERLFFEDTDRKVEESSPLMREMAERWAVEPYLELERLRTSKPPDA